MAIPRIETTVLAPEGVVYQGEVLAVTGTNKTGKFSILPNHTRFISLISGPVILHEKKRSAKTIEVKNGVICCRENKVSIFVGLPLAREPEKKR